MKHLRWFLRGLKFAASAGLVWSVLYANALAQMKQETKGSSTTGGGPYVLAYCLVILAITFGLLVVCRSSGRRDRARPEQYADGKIGTRPDEKKSPAGKSGK